MDVFSGVLRWLSNKESACNAGDPSLIPGSGRSSGEGNGNPLQYSCLENPMDRGAWWATVHGVAKSWTRLSTHIVWSSTSCTVFFFFLKMCLMFVYLCLVAPGNLPNPGIEPGLPHCRRILYHLNHQGSFMNISFMCYAKSLQSCLTLCDPTDGSPPGSPVPGILQARTLEWVAISFSSAWKWKVKVKSLSRVWLLATPWTAAYQAPPSMGFSRQEYWSDPQNSPRSISVFSMHWIRLGIPPIFLKKSLTASDLSPLTQPLSRPASPLLSGDSSPSSWDFPFPFLVLDHLFPGFHIYFFFKKIFIYFGYTGSHML